MGEASRRASALGLAAAALTGASAILLASQQPAVSDQARIKTGVDLVQIDVTVLDRLGLPVRGLTAADFTILENGKPQEIRGFTAVDTPPPVPTGAPWIREASYDVVTNTAETRRLVVILMDDGETGFDQGEAAMVKKIARAAIDRLGPSDFTAVVFSYLGRAQNFTADRQALIAAVESYTPRKTAMVPSLSKTQGFGMGTTGPPAACLVRRGGCVGDALRNIGTFLQSAPAGRKLLIYVGSGPSIHIDPDNSDQASTVIDMFKALQDANVEVNAFDATGLQTFAANANDASMLDAKRRIGAAKGRQEGLKSLAENTGGRAFTDTNAPDGAVDDVFLRNSSYYLLGYQSTDSRQDGKYRRVQVRVNRPDLDVRARSGYYATKRPHERKKSDSTELESTLSYGLAASDVPLVLNAGVLATPGQGDPFVIVTAGLRPSENGGALPVTMLSAAFDDGWNERARQQQSFAVSVPADRFADLLYDVYSPLKVRPGRYEIRVAAETGGRRGSVIGSIDVPDFEKEELSLSSIFVERTPALAVKESLPAGLLPVVPTTARVFARQDRVSVFVRIYQGGRKALVPVTVTTRTVNDRGETSGEQRREIAVNEFRTSRSSDYQLELSLDDLAPGKYLFSLEASAGVRRLSRTVRFELR